jgi:hypothetical protein
VASSVGTDQLLGGPGSRPAAVDALAARTLVKGEPLAPPAGRADDFVWPRRRSAAAAKGDIRRRSHIAERNDTGNIWQKQLLPPQQHQPQQKEANPADPASAERTPSLRDSSGLNRVAPAGAAGSRTAAHATPRRRARRARRTIGGGTAGQHHAIIAAICPTGADSLDVTSRAIGRRENSSIQSISRHRPRWSADDVGFKAATPEQRGARHVGRCSQPNGSAPAPSSRFDLRWSPWSSCADQAGSDAVDPIPSPPTPAQRASARPHRSWKRCRSELPMVE